MDDVQRWEVTYNANGLGLSDGIRQSPHGNFVSLDDYRALEAQLAKADALADLMSEGECPWRDDTSHYREWWQDRKEALAEYRAARGKAK